MNRTSNLRIGAAVVSLCIGALAWSAIAAGPGYDGPGAWSSASAWFVLMVMPGLALYLWLGREPGLLEALACALAASPVIVAALAVPAMLAGAGALAAARVLVIVAPVLVAGALVTGREPRGGMPASRLVLIAAVVLVLCALTAYLPLSDAWWRMRSDAWAHRAWIAEVADFGIPPMDPYFAGFPLQYMWAYHAMVNTVSDAANVDPFYAMAFVNIGALAGYMLCTFIFAGTLTPSFGRRFASMVTATLGLNAAGWVFLPLKAIKAFTGQVHGTAEIARQFSIVPFDYGSAMQFMMIYHNKTFLLDKFMVATAFGLALCLMACAWWSASAYLKNGRPLPLAMAFLSTLGMLAFHTLVGSVMMAGIVGSAAILFLFCRRVDGYSTPRALALVAAVVLAFAVTSPYLYSIMHSKETIGHNPPLHTLRRLIGMGISVAFVAVLAWFQRGFARRRSLIPRFVTVAAALITVYSLLVPLPGPNRYDKPVLFVFFPLAVVGAWTLVDLYRRRRVLAVVIALLAFVPLNGIALAAAFNTQPRWSESADEKAAAAWIREHTERGDVLLDDDAHLSFLVLGPRRYLWGRVSYADQWGYDRLEMSRRLHAWRTVYSARPMDTVTLATLGEVHVGLYVVVRRDRHPDVNALTLHEYFQPVHTAGSITIVKVDTARCRADAASGRFPTISDEELIRESGLD